MCVIKRFFLSLHFFSPDFYNEQLAPTVCRTAGQIILLINYKSEFKANSEELITLAALEKLEGTSK